jgi:hypothetical protein
LPRPDQVLLHLFLLFSKAHFIIFQALRPGRKKLNLPAGCVERTEAQPFYRVTSSRSQMEVDFWRHIMMPLKSGLPSEVKKYIN